MREIHVRTAQVPGEGGPAGEGRGECRHQVGMVEPTLHHVRPPRPQQPDKPEEGDGGGEATPHPKARHGYAGGADRVRRRTRRHERDHLMLNARAIGGSDQTGEHPLSPADIEVVYHVQHPDGRMHGRRGMIRFHGFGVSALSLRCRPYRLVQVLVQSEGRLVRLLALIAGCAITMYMWPIAVRLCGEIAAPFMGADSAPPPYRGRAA